MADYAPAPNYPNYAGFLSNLIGGLPTDYRNAQLQQGQVDVQNAFKGGVPTNDDGTPNYAAALQTLAKAGDPGAVAALGPAAQTQAWQTQAGTMSTMLSGAGAGQPPAATPAPPAPPPLQRQPPTPPPQPQSAGFTGSIADGAASPPPSTTLSAMISGIIPDPTKSAMATGLIAKALKVDPSAPLTPDQAAKVQRIVTANRLAPTDASAFAGTEAPAPAVAAISPQPPPAPAAAIAASPGGNASPGAGGSTGPFALSPAAEAVWQRMVPSAGSAESGGSQTGPDGSILTSPKGARGVSQVMPGTGPEAARLAGLPWDPVLFNGTGPAAKEYSLALGKAYYAKQVQTFGAPDIAAAAYNAGPKAIVSAMAKAASRGGSWLDYAPAETQDYVAKVTGGGGAPQAGGGAAAAAPPSGNRPIGSQVPLPPGITDPGQAIVALDREIARVASSPNPYIARQAEGLTDWRDRIADSMKLVSVGPTTKMFDQRTGQPVMEGAFASGGGMTPEAIDNAAMTSLRTGQDPKNMGKGAQGAQQLIEIQNRKAEIMAENGWSPDDVAQMQQKFKAQQGVLKEFESGKDSRSVGSYNTLVSHLETLRTAIGALQNGDIRALNWFRQEWNRQTGNPAPTNFEGVKELVGDELIKAITGGAGALGDREGVKRTLDAASSPQALNSMLDQYRDLSIGQLKTFRRRYEFGTGRKDFDEMLAPETRSYFGNGGGAQSTTAPPAPGAVAKGPVPAGTYDVDMSTGVFIPAAGAQ